MHHSGPSPLIFKGLEQGFGDKNCQNASQEKPDERTVRQVNRHCTKKKKQESMIISI